ncbi:hypothetical protein [Legionella busanensis]|uniref:hypothetical protein n=1 Tax=Legionella busanensis TaxID=190655 RepID=UPI001041BAD7|nr:hypothetical protein [Legionella busanensis]
MKPGFRPYGPAPRLLNRYQLNDVQPNKSGIYYTSYDEKCWIALGLAQPTFTVFAIEFPKKSNIFLDFVYAKLRINIKINRELIFIK